MDGYFRRSTMRPMAAASLALLLCAPSAGAQQTGAEPERPLDLTPEQDSYSDRTSMPGHSTADTGAAGTVFSFSFNDLDVDSNDIITREEAVQEPSLGQAFEEVDRNGDLKISPAEFAAFERLELMRQRQESGASGADGAPSQPSPGSAPP